MEDSRGIVEEISRSKGEDFGRIEVTSGILKLVSPGRRPKSCAIHSLPFSSFPIADFRRFPDFDLRFKGEEFGRMELSLDILKLVSPGGRLNRSRQIKAFFIGE